MSNYWLNVMSNMQTASIVFSAIFTIISFFLLFLACAEAEEKEHIKGMALFLLISFFISLFMTMFFVVAAIFIPAGGC